MSLEYGAGLYFKFQGPGVKVFVDFKDAILDLPEISEQVIALRMGWA